MHSHTPRQSFFNSGTLCRRWIKLVATCRTQVLKSKLSPSNRKTRSYGPSIKSIMRCVKITFIICMSLEIKLSWNVANVASCSPVTSTSDLACRSWCRHAVMQLGRREVCDPTGRNHYGPCQNLYVYSEPSNHQHMPLSTASGGMNFLARTHPPVSKSILKLREISELLPNCNLLKILKSSLVIMMTSQYYVCLRWVCTR